MTLLAAPLRMAVDAMGGDAGLSVTVPAIRQISQKYPDIHFQVYVESEFCDELHSLNSLSNTTLVPASNSIAMTDDPIQALRHKRHSSMALAISAVAEEQVHGCLSAGNTGALVALGVHYLKTYEGIDRPALCQEIPTAGAPTYLLDMGANVDCSAKQLVQLAYLGASLCSVLKGISQPIVKLLNVGSESSKGSVVTKSAAELLSQHHAINYRGFVEGHEIYEGNSHVIVCDGFNGNVALKASEGVARFMVSNLQQDCRKTFYGRLIGWLAKPLLKRWQEKMDVDRYNGAYLLGLRGVLVKSHGSANVRQFTYAMEMLIHQLQRQSNADIRNELADYFEKLNKSYTT